MSKTPGKNSHHALPGIGGDAAISFRGLRTPTEVKKKRIDKIIGSPRIKCGFRSASKPFKSYWWRTGRGS